MSSNVESVQLNEEANDMVDLVELSDEDNVQINEEANDMADEILDNEGDGSKRKSSSGAWSHFTTVEVQENGKMVKKHECMHCKKKYAPQSSRTTTHLLRHLKKCVFVKRLKGTKGFINFQPSDNENASEFNAMGGYDQMKCRELIAKLIIAHELPFSFVEYHWFNILMKYNNPLYQKVSMATIRKDCIKVVELEREKLKKVLKKVDMISLTSDCWTSNQTIGYMCLTAHYIDSNWKMQKRIIGFNELAPPHSGEVISDAILECLIKWGIQDKIGTITLDNASSNDRAASILKNTFQGKGKLHFEGMFFHVRCCAHILNLVVQDGLGTIDCCLVKIREGVKYVRKSPGRLLKFGEIAITLGIPTRRSLCIDVKTRWNSTHRMLESAMHYKLAYQGYALRDSNFEWSLTDDEWNRAQKVCKVLEVFLDATNLFSGTSYPTTNLFLVEIFKVKKEISSCYISNDGFLKKMSEPMFEKFEKYWGEIGVLMAIASILDPRFKKVSISWTFGKLYPSNEVDDRVEDVINRLQSLYVKYSTAFHMARASKNNMMSTSSGATDVRDRIEDDFYAFLKSRPVENTQKSEVEVYLDEPNYIVLENKEFDVLSWWSQNSSKFPVLSKMARNIFSIPITTVASESAFSAGGRILDDYRSSLTKDMVELLVCGGDWIKATSKTTIQTLQHVSVSDFFKFFSSNKTIVQRHLYMVKID
ncbi:zinc finger BED domain-containing protein RICESLEEPER 2-like [Helianthus annuus]|uniref:zinc finger BED domain-containing protein RICESLEEPER 2-like n=1 Tax=Helianthus annuus TaxID=4232 RepID=UPI001652F1EF|nr:zinc finger BED domain-containing protein RICESLEEPER 2-like [Helianthus annuus]